MGSLCWAPLELAIVLVSPESIRKNTSDGLVPEHLDTTVVSAGTQLATSAITVVLFTVLNAFEQSLITSQLPVSFSVRALSLTCFNPPGTETPNCLTSRLTSNRSRHCRMTPEVMSLHHDMLT